MRRPRRGTADLGGDGPLRASDRVRGRPPRDQPRRPRARAAVFGRGQRRALLRARGAGGRLDRRRDRAARRARPRARTRWRDASVAAARDRARARPGPDPRRRAGRRGAAERERRLSRGRARRRARGGADPLRHRRSGSAPRRRGRAHARSGRRGSPAGRGRARGRDRPEGPCGDGRRTPRRPRRDRRDGGGRVSTVVSQAVLPTYARQAVTLVAGDGAWLVDAEGRRYLDFLAGIAVVGLGHGHPAPLVAAHAQLERLWHVSNLYWTEPMTQLADRLSQRFGGAQAFFCNSGAEAIEAALKYARKASGKTEIVALEGSFHGRTCGALSVTGQPAKRAAFEPLLPGVAFASPDDVASLEAEVTNETGCILLEPVLGEGGIIPLDARFVEAARTLADDAGALLVFDEVQTGVGRTGTFFAFEQLGVRPDAVTLAKGLANGLPIGCLLVADAAAGAFVPGDHASTFGGNPVACAAAVAVCDTVDDELLAGVIAHGATIASRLPSVRGRGLLLAVDTPCSAADVVADCLERGLLVGTAGESSLRLTPPLTLTADELEHALAILEEVL